ncbi:MAG: hypothetical protein COA79_10175 [Planctomycetota bacterium]|nr:MAG: hypothetical protein COA79_10175 [Planctomycetota bacterium]
MKVVSFIILICFYIIFSSCGNSNAVDVYSTKPSNLFEEIIWGKPIDLSPKTNNDLIKKWVVYSGAWHVKNERLETLPVKEGESLEHIILFKQNIFGDFAIEFNANIKNQEALDEGGDLSVILSADDKLEKRYDLQLGGLDNKFAVIQMYNLPMAKINFILEPNKDYKFRAERIGDKLNLFCDGVKVLTSKNQYFLSGRKNGLYTYGKGKQFWNIKLYERRMRGHDLELKSVDRLLSKVIQSPNKFRKISGSIRTLYEEIIFSYPNEPKLRDRINLRLATMEISLGNFKEASDLLSSLESSGNDYDVLILKSKAFFLIGDFEKSKQSFLKCLKDYSNFQAGTAGSIKNLLISTHARSIPTEYQGFFWGTYLKHTILKKAIFNYANLNNIDFFENAFTNKGTTNLNTIDISDNNISSLKPLANYKKLNSISVSGNPKIKDLKTFNNISIKALSISNTNIKSLDGLNRDSLLSLNIDEMNLENFNLLKGCPNIYRLSAKDNSLKDLNELSSLKEIKYLSLSQNKIEDISKLNVSELRQLSMEHNVLSSIDNLSNAKELVTLNINNNNISSLDKISDLPKLKSLNCVNNPIKSFGKFAESPPITFFFTIDALSEEYIKLLLKNWSKQEYQLHEQNLKILLELKKGDKANLKQFAIKNNNHYYLSIPLLLNIPDAHKFCKKHGGHLISIVGKEELDDKIVTRMPSTHYWIGLEEIDGVIKWSTGEDMKLDRMLPIYNRRLPTDVNYGLTHRNRWTALKPDLTLPFIIEWDE